MCRAIYLFPSVMDFLLATADGRLQAPYQYDVRKNTSRHCDTTVYLRCPVYSTPTADWHLHTSSMISPAGVSDTWGGNCTPNTNERGFCSKIHKFELSPRFDQYATNIRTVCNTLTYNSPTLFIFDLNPSDITGLHKSIRFWLSSQILRRISVNDLGTSLSQLVCL